MSGTANPYLYEIRCVYSRKLALDIKGENTGQGAYAILYPAADGNNQKFLVTSAGDGLFYIKALHSGRKLGTRSSASDGDCVTQWGDGTETNLKWAIEAFETGGSPETTTIEGVECPVVTIAPAANASLRMDCKQAMTDGFARTCKATDEAPDVVYQKWALKPTTRYYADGAVPYDGAMAVDDTGALYTVYDTVPAVYPSFRVPSYWLSTNTYAFRWRKRDMSPDATWGEQSDWSAWLTPSVVTKGDRVWIGTGLNADYSWGECKHREFSVQARCQGEWSDGYAYYGPVYGFTLHVCKAPTIKFYDATWSPLGLSLDVETDYLKGSNRIVITKLNGWSGQYAIENVTNSVSGGQQLRQTVFLPVETFGSFAAGDAIDLEWYVGNDQHNLHVEKRDTSSYGSSGQPPRLVVGTSGGSLAFSPSVSIDANGILTVVAKNGSVVYPNSRAWVVTDGVVTELKGASGYFRDLAPIKASTLYVLAQNKAKTSWGIRSCALEGGFVPSCAIVADNGMILVVRARANGPLEDVVAVNAKYEASSLDSRKYMTYTSSPTVEMGFRVEGSIFWDEIDYTIEDIEALANQHVTYRRPLGAVHGCFIDSISAAAVKDYVAVSISLHVESV